MWLCCNYRNLALRKLIHLNWLRKRSLALPGWISSLNQSPGKEVWLQTASSKFTILCKDISSSFFFCLLVILTDIFLIFLKIISDSVMDTNDRFLRKITIGQSPTEKGYTRTVSLINALIVSTFLVFLMNWISVVHEVKACVCFIGSVWHHCGQWDHGCVGSHQQSGGHEAEAG